MCIRDSGNPQSPAMQREESFPLSTNGRCQKAQLRHRTLPSVRSAGAPPPANLPRNGSPTPSSGRQSILRSPKQQVMLEPLLLGATRNRHGHRVPPTIRKTPDGNNTRTRNPSKQHPGMAKKRNHLPERQVHRNTGRGGPHYPFPDNRTKADKTPIPVRPRSPPGSGEWESD